MGKVIILGETTKNPITLMGKRAGICWGADISDDEKNYARGMDCIKSNHGRVMEYVNVEMILENYSARVIREWYTHLGGAPTRLQASTRRIDYSNFKYVTPPSIARQKSGALAIYEGAMERIAFICEELENKFGIPREDAAMLLPLGMCTTIVDKRNLRNLVDMSHQRMCGSAYHEYRALFTDICGELSKVSEEWVWIVCNLFRPKCEVYGKCKEKYSCGHFKQMEAEGEVQYGIEKQMFRHR